MLFLPLLAAAEPLDVLSAEGCLACHPAGGAGVGPSLAELVGRTEVVVRAGAPVTVTVDVTHIRRALTDPNADVVQGFVGGVMPAVTAPARVDALVAALAGLAEPAPPSRWWIVGVFAGGLGFTGGHLLLSSQALRARLVARVGENAFMALYSAPISAALALLVYAWTKAPYIPVWDPAAWTRWAPALVMPFVMIAQVAGYSTPTPTMAGMADRVGEAPRGIHRITRHPVNITAAIWAAAHLLPNGDVASIGLFGTMLVLGVAGSLHIDRRRAAANPDAWARYAAQTSAVPFLAIAQGRNQLVLAEIGAARIVVGLVLYVVLLVWGHGWAIGASALP